jgi:hypothetical protein
VSRIDVQQREWKTRRAESLLGEPEKNDRVLAAGKQQTGPFALGGQLAKDVNRLVFERLEVGTTIGADGLLYRKSVISDNHPM